MPPRSTDRESAEDWVGSWTCSFRWPRYVYAPVEHS